MHYLSDGLKKYYKREKSRIIFQNGSSLQEFAITLWEKLGFTQVDISVLSRVLKGERLFTPVQLEAFCEILKLSPSEAAYLFRCLSQDYLLKGGVKSPALFESTSVVDTLDFLDHLVKDTYKTFHNGLGIKIQKNCLDIQRYIDKLSAHSLSDVSRDKLYELMATSLYVYGRSMCAHSLPELIFKEVEPIVNQLKSLVQETNNPRIKLCLEVLYGEIYYIAGGYSSAEKSLDYHKHAVKYNMKALKDFPLNDYEKLVALRNGAASANYTNDKDTVLEIIKESENAIFGATPETRIIGLQLVGTLAKSAAIFKLPQPTKLKDAALTYYDGDLTGGGVTEISDIKTEIETMQILGNKDVKHLKRLITKGLILAERENLPRHIQSFTKANENFS